MISNSSEMTGIEMENEDRFKSTIFVFVNRLANCMDHYRVGHLDRLAKIKNDLNPNDFSLIGNGYTGIGMTHCVYQAEKNAKRVIHQLSSSDKNQTQFTLTNSS